MNILDKVFRFLYYDKNGNVSILRLIIKWSFITLIAFLLIRESDGSAPVYRSDKTHKYELYMLGGFKDTLELRYEPDQLYIANFFGSYTLKGEGKPFSITIKEGCVNFKPLK